MLEIFINRAVFILRDGLAIVFDTYFLWIPLFLLFFAWSYWKRYIIRDALLNTETVVMQLKIPREITKSPKAMEVFLNNLNQTSGERTPYDRYWLGKTRPWFSLEIVSVEGEIRFYIWTREKFSKLIEAQIYAQFPTVEVIMDAPDYTKKIGYDPDKISLFGTEIKFTKDDYFPIKTYVDYGLDEDPKEEFKVDPLASMLEFLGSVGSGEHVWIQFLVRAHKKYEKKTTLEKLQKTFGKIFEKKENKNFAEAGKKEVDKMMKRDEEFKEGDTFNKLFVQSKGEQKVIEAIERSVSKPGFDTAIRIIYLAEVDKFDLANIGGLMNVLRHYNSDGLNGFKPDDKTKTDFDYPWQDPIGGRLAKRKADIFNNYAKRAHFRSRYNAKDMILNTEELATLFHFPSAVVETPTLPRIESKKAEPPTNLPQ